jgi:DNA polymerase-3 subunit delta'
MPNTPTLLWEQMQRLVLTNRFPQSVLFIGPRYEAMLHFIKRLEMLLLCQQSTPPCGQCRACHLLSESIHPDRSDIQPETPGGMIKIDQIRCIQESVYQTPKVSLRRVIVIDSADRMNIAAANALLKILEEPPAHTVFILLAQQINSIPATILSRCQKYTIPTPELPDYLALGQFYPGESTRAQLAKQSADILTVLCDLIEEKTSVCWVAKHWSSYQLEDIVWLLYLITAQTLQLHYVNSKSVVGKASLLRFASLQQPVHLFKQLEALNAITQKINHNINMNQTLVLETLLLGYLKSDSL